MNALAPQRLRLPALRTPHSRRVNGRIFRQQCLDVAGERVLRVNGVQPVGNTAENGIRLVGNNRYCCYPLIQRTSEHLWHHWQCAVPNAGMVCTIIPQRINCQHPTFKGLVLSNFEVASNLSLCGFIRYVAIQLSKTSKRNKFQHLPCGWVVGESILGLMFFDEFFFSSLQLAFQCGQIFRKPHFVNSQSDVNKPKRTMRQRELVYDTRSQCYFYLLYGTEQQFTQFYIKRIKCNGLFERGTLLELVCLLVLLQRPQISSKAKIADSPKKKSGSVGVNNGQTTLLQNVKLVTNTERGFVVFHIKIYIQKVPPWGHFILCRREVWRMLMLQRYKLFLKLPNV